MARILANCATCLTHRLAPLSRAARYRSARAWTLVSASIWVVASCACPRNVWTSSIGMPASSRIVALACRTRCGYTPFHPGVRALRHHRLHAANRVAVMPIAFKHLPALSAPPCVHNSCASVGKMGTWRSLWRLACLIRMCGMSLSSCTSTTRSCTNSWTRAPVKNEPLDHQSSAATQPLRLGMVDETCNTVRFHALHR